jgi:iron complex outermembrane recepter protein
MTATTDHPSAIRITLGTAILLGLCSALHAQSVPANPPATSATASEFEPANEPPITLSPFEVNTAQDEGYRSTQSASGNKTGTAIRETPQSIQIINRSFMDDIQARSIADALLYTSGITEGENPRGDRFEIRGFTSGIPFKNGFRDTGRAPRDNASIDRIEVAKGPASVIFSRTSAGGAVNLLTKLPQRRRAYEAGAHVGGYDYYRATFDATGPLAGDNLLYRLNVAWQDSGSFRDQFFIHRIFVTPVVSWIMGPRTRLNLEFEYLRDSRTPDPGLVVLRNRVVKVPPSTFFGDPGDVNRVKTVTARYELLHTFVSGISLRHAFRVNQTNERGYETIFGAVNANTLTVVRNRNHLVKEQVDNFYFHTEATYELKATGGRHKLIAGHEWGYNFDGGITNRATYTAANVHAPTPGVTGAFTTNQRWVDVTNWFNEYFVQDQFYCFGDKLALLAGVRLAYFETFNTNKRTGVKTDTSGHAPNPRYGIVYMPSDRVALFVNHSDLLNVQTGSNPDGTTFDPARNTLLEGGVRLDVIKRRLTLTGGVYELRNENVLNPDPFNPGFRVQTGELRTRGVELDMTGSPLPGWRVIGSANYQDAIISRDLGPNKGNRRPNTPTRTYSLWNRWQAQEGPLKGFAAGIGVIAIGGRFGDVGNTFYNPAYLRFDGSISYRTRKWDAALNVQNLGDEEYMRTTVRPGSPRDFSLRLRHRF